MTRRSSLALAPLFAFACGGEPASQPDATAPDATAPAPDATMPDAGILGVSETNPADLEEDVEPGVAIRAEFTVPMNSDTIGPSTFQLSDGTNAVAGTVTYHGGFRLATFVPEVPLDFTTAYTATITTGVESADGQVLASDVTWSFTTRPPAWSAPVQLDVAGGLFASAMPKVVVDPAGNAIAVWQQTDGTRTNSWTARFAPATGWASAQLLETDNAGPSDFADVDVDADGNAIAVWHQSNGVRYSIWASRYTSAWSAPELVETDDTGDAFVPRVAAHASGEAIVVWGQHDGTRYNLTANDFAPGSGWATAAPIETDAGDAFAPRVAVDPSGNAIAIWPQAYSIWVNRRIPGGWGTAEPVEVGGGGADDPDLDLDAAGDAIAVWTQSDGTHMNIWANRFTPTDGWGDAEQIELDETGDAYMPRVAMDPAGNAMVVWRQWDGEDFSIWANRFEPGPGWGVATLVETQPGDATGPQLCSDGLGNVSAVWAQYNGTDYDLRSARYAAATGWVPDPPIEDGIFAVSDPEIACNAAGNAVAVWLQASRLFASVLR